MRIGLVRRGFSGTGGAEGYLGRFAEALTGAGHECVLFVGEGWRGEDWRWGEMRVLGGRAPRAFADALAAADPRGACDRLFSLERVWSCDVYRAGDGVHREWLAIRAQHEPGLASLVRSWSAKHRQLLEIEARLFSRAGAGAVIANSRMVKEDILRHFDFPAERIHVVYNGLSPRPVAPEARAAKRQALGIGSSTVVALFAGSGWERKGLRFAMQGVERAEADAVLLVAGEGKKRTLPAARRTRFLGAVADMPELMAASDVFVLPTLYEPFSNACLEALAAGLPVITTRRNGFSEIMETGVHGDVLDDPADSASLARALDGWADAGRRERARAECASLAGGFGIEQNLSATLRVLTASARFAAPHCSLPP